MYATFQPFFLQPVHISLILYIYIPILLESHIIILLVGAVASQRQLNESRRSNLPCWLRKLLCRCPLNGFLCHQSGGSPRELRSHGSQQRGMLVPKNLTPRKWSSDASAKFISTPLSLPFQCPKSMPGQGHSQLCPRWLVGLGSHIPHGRAQCPTEVSLLHRVSRSWRTWEGKFVIVKKKLQTFYCQTGTAGTCVDLMNSETLCFCHGLTTLRCLDLDDTSSTAEALASQLKNWLKQLQNSEAHLINHGPSHCWELWSPWCFEAVFVEPSFAYGLCTKEP